jgi:hypothetical protein
VGFPFECEFRYRRAGDVARIQTRSLTNHELRNILIGMWLSMDDDDRRDHVAELDHYLQPGSRPPGVAVEIAESIQREREKS